MVRKLFGMLVCALFALPLVGNSSTLYNFSEDDVNALLQVRPALFGGSEIQAALQQSTIDGSQPPIFGYDLKDRAILSWKLKDSDASAFATSVGLPPWMALAQVSPITESQSKWGKQRGGGKGHYVVVDIANADRFVQGTIVEWKTFVTIGADPTPRLVRFDSQRAVAGIDFLDAFSAPFGLVEWGVDDAGAAGVVTDGQSLLDIKISVEDETPRRWRGYGDDDDDDEDDEGDYRRWFFRALDKQQFTEEFLTAGERIFSPIGAQARYYYDGSSVSAEFYSVDLRKVKVTNTFPWAQFLGQLESVSLLKGETRHLVQPIGPAVEADSFEAGLFGQLTGMILGGAAQEDVFAVLQQAAGSDKFLTLYFGVFHIYQALQIFSGQELPKMVFSLKKSPKTVFINFEIPRSKVRAFKKAFLPDHFELAKIRFYPEQKRPVYAVSLNIYDAVGQSVSGYRAEWSTYVINPEEENPKPRFSVIEAQTTSFGLDPLHALEVIQSGQYDPTNLFSILEGPADVFEFAMDEENGLQVTLRDFAEDIKVDVSVDYPDEDKILRTKPLKSWMEANDFVYWGEAADILKYDNNVMFADLIVFKADSADLIKDTTFKDYVKPKPLPIILWDGIQDIALEPWGNLKDIQTAP